ncbi:type II secretion system protein [Clostridium tetani]|uniref:type II secretion system protein n=1 Tax=Clostridium tetani TaxID=1513 RepID=UPI0005131EFD|nr:prepilin-type N-terminal cleavage/methylation domain-containing protein [Clostridium tetani]KGI39824.1 hypothetical protein LA33_03760 [Clostridium tetani ATCC 9441]SUY66687.1 prepilin peptidase [Clostridium tetani]
MLFNKRKPGFTLIELIIVMAIISSVAIVININRKGFSTLTNSIDCKMCNNEITNFINISKQRSRESNTLGNILFSKSNNSLILYSNSKKIKEYSLPKGFKMRNVNAQNNRIYITSRGLIQDACTFTYEDRKGETHAITICVGTGHVQVK